MSTPQGSGGRELDPRNAFREACLRDRAPRRLGLGT